MTAAVPAAPQQNRKLIPATSDWEWVTPKQAAQWLLANTANRNIQEVRVARYARDMANGHWIPTHQGVAFTVDGTLIDGQHRLQAQVQAGVGLWLLVTRDLDMEAQRYVDQGRSRGAGDFFEGKYKHIRASAIRQLIVLRNEEGTISAGRLGKQIQDITIGEIHAFAEAEPGIVGDVDALVGLAASASRFAPVGPGSLLTAAATYPDIGETMLEMVNTGVGLEPGNPALAMRNSGNNFSRNQGHALVAALKAFEYLHRGKALRVLRVSPTETLQVTPR